MSSKVFCDVCKFVVKADGHASRCNVKKEGSSVVRASAWLGDAEVSMDIREIVLMSGQDCKVWQSLLQKYTDRTSQASFYSSYTGRKVISFGTSEHSIAQSFESTYYYDDAFRLEYLESVCRELVVESHVGISERQGRSVSCEVLDEKYWQDCCSVVLSDSSKSAGSAEETLRSDESCGAVARVGTVSDSEFAWYSMSRTSEFTVGSSNSSSRARTIESGGKGGPAELRAHNIRVFLRHKKAVAEIGVGNLCHSSVVRSMKPDVWMDSDKIVRDLNVSESSYRCRGCKQRFLTKGQMWNHLSQVLYGLSKLVTAHDHWCHFVQNSHHYVEYKCFNHLGTGCMAICGDEGGEWKLRVCDSVVKGDVWPGRNLRLVSTLCLSKLCCVCETGSSEFRSFGAYSCGSCSACVSFRQRDAD